MSASPAVKLRESIVLLVVRSIIGLTGALYGAVIALLLIATIREKPLPAAVPTELWAAAALGFGYVAGILTNTKHDSSPDNPDSVQVVNQADDPVPVEQPPPAEEEVLDDPEPAPKKERKKST